jgi:hypothetical protein
MKRVFRMQGQGKVKDVGLRGLGTVPAAEGIDSTVALIQALIPVGLEAVGEALEAEATALAGECGTGAAVAAPGSSAGVASAGRSTSRIRSSPSRIPGCGISPRTGRFPSGRISASMSLDRLIGGCCSKSSGA